MRKSIFTAFLVSFFQLVIAQQFTLQSSITFTGVNYGSNKCAGFVDVNNDNWLDVFFSGGIDIIGIEGFTGIYTNNGNNTFTPLAGLPVADFFSDEVDWMDFNNDGYIDFLISSGGQTFSLSDGTHLLKNNGNSTFTEVLYLTRGAALAWGDYNNDGLTDFALGEGAYYTSPYTVQLYMNLGDTTFVPDTNNVFPTTTEIVKRVKFTDYNNDGYLDLIVIRGGTPPSLYHNNGDGTFTENPAFNLLSNSKNALSLIDYNNDGYLDIYNGRADIFINNSGIGSYSSISLNSVISLDGGNDMGDYNNDGLPDLIMSGSVSCASKIYRNDGSNNFTLTGDTITPLSLNSTDKWGDYNNDGFLDIVLAGHGLSQMDKYSELYKNDGSGTANTPPSAPLNLQAVTDGCNSATLSWSAASDAQTNVNALTYNVRIGTSPGGQDIVSCMSNTATGFRRIPSNGNAECRTFFIIKNLAAGTYYWSVQAIDQAYAGGLFASEDSFIVTPLSMPIINDTFLCGPGTIVLINNSIYESYWYDVPVGGTPVDTGFVFTTPYLSSADTFYATVFSGICESERDTIIINLFTPPSVTFIWTDSVYLSDPPFALSGGSPPGGIYSGPGVSGGVFDPASSGTGSHIINYSYTDGNGCSDSDTALVNVYSLTGLSEDFSSQVKFWPNPSNRYLYVSWNASARYSLMQIFNQQGSEVGRKILYGSEVILDISKLEHGTYIALLSGETRQYFKFIKE